MNGTRMTRMTRIERIVADLCVKKSATIRLIRGIRVPFLIRMIAATLLAACTTETERVWHEEDGYRWAEVNVASGGEPGFTQMMPAQTGVDFVNHLQEDQFLANRHYVNGSGVALGDVDGDSLPDLYFARLDGPNALYRNLGGWRFEEITDRAGVAAPGRFSTGAVLADLDGDTDLDLLVTAMGGPNAAFLNDGTGRFTEVTEAAGLTSDAGSTTMALADVDGDGDLDLYVGNYKKNTVKDLFPPSRLAFERVVVQQGEVFSIVSELQAHYRLQQQGNRLMRFEYAEPDRFYLNDGAGRFTPVPFTDGAFLDEDGNPLAEAPHDWALTARFQDLNGDTHPDLFVCNDFESPDHLWLGDGAGGFRAAPRLALRKTSQSTMSVAVSDVDADGHVDVFLADMLSPVYARRQAQVQMTPPVRSGIGDIDNRPQEMQNVLLLGRGEGTFAETANFAGMAASEWTWSGVFVDVDLDGYEDLLLTNGHAYDAMDADTQMRVSNVPAGRAWQRLLLLFPKLDLKNIAFRNRGDGTFETMPDGWGIGPEADVSHGLALADLDGDGDLDAVVNRLNRSAGLFRNDAASPRLAVRLRGAAPNTHGIGATVRVSGGGLPLRTKEVLAGGQYLSSSETLYSFAAATPGGAVADSLRIEVHWRSGRRSVLEGVRGNRIYELYEVAAPPPDSVDAPAQDAPRPFFEEMAGEPVYTHQEAAYEDFARQPLLPRRLSQRGPAVVWADLIGDQDDDLLVGSGRGGRLTFLRNTGGFFYTIPAFNDAADGDHAGIVAMPGAAGGSRIFVGVSNYERTPETAGDSSYVMVYEMDTRGRVRAVDRLTFGLETIGPLALADLDGDGDLDLFAGGHFVPGRYPLAASSRIYRNEEGRFRLDETMSTPFARLGLVSGAVLGDLDADGDADMALATEWGPVRLFINQGEGRFEDRTETYGLAAYTGWWNGVALGDFDADGRLDLIATNWGWNTKYGRPETAAYPLRLYHGDFDRNGILDLFEARYEAQLGDYAPVRGLTTLSYAVPAIRGRVQTFQQFAASTLAEVVGGSLEGVPFEEASVLGAMVFMNRGTWFEARPLPPRAQWAPAFAATVADFDGDGREDVFLSQNFFALPPETPRMDAGQGLWLRGDGTGGFTEVPAQTSGVRVYGEQRAATVGDINIDGRVDLVVTQNAAPLIMYKNNRAEVGLRVRLSGPPGNPWGVGATVRLRYADGSLGPGRVVTAGSGYWSQASPVLVMAKPEGVQAVWVRWPDGAETEGAVPAGMVEVTFPYDGWEGM